jgi:hypothetical protein
MNPTVAPTVEITLDGEVRTLKFGLLAFKALGINPFNKESIERFNARKMDLQAVAELIHAGILHEYHGKAATRRGQIPPTPEDLLADYELDQFADACSKVLDILQDDSKETAKEPSEENPPQA